MKKIFAVLLCLATVLFCFSSCKSAAVKELEVRIGGLKEVSVDTAAAVREIEEAYAALTEEEKAQVENYDEFIRIMEASVLLTQYKNDAKKLLDEYELIFAEYGITAKDIKASFEDLKTRYEKCPDTIKNACGEIFSELSAANDSYNEVAGSAVASAAVYVNGFLAKNADRKITVRDIGCIAQKSEGVTYFLFALSYDDGDATDKRVYSAVRFTGTPAIVTTDKFAADLYRDTPALEKTDALVNRNIDIDIQTVLDAVNR